MTQSTSVFAWSFGLVLAYVLLAGINPIVVDDTFITFQYARNLVDHGRLTWWHEGPMVDGYTSLGHVLLLSLGRWLGFDLLAVNMLINLSAVCA
ncbi:MAG: hypothetical protein AAF245_01360, partial [Pseudomonadota bacterium]